MDEDRGRPVEPDPGDAQRSSPATHSGCESGKEPVRDEARFQRLVECAQDPILEIDAETRILYVNPRYTEVSGLRADEVLGTPALDRVHPEDRPAAVAACERAFGHGEASKVMVRYQRQDGGWIWLEIVGRPYQTDSGEDRAVLVIREMSDRIEAARLLREQLEMERRIADLARRFLGLRPEELKAGIQLGLETAAAMTDADRVRFAALAAGFRAPATYYQWSREGVPEVPEPDLEKARALYPWSAQRLLAGEIVALRASVEPPPEAANEYEELRAEGIRSYLAIPVFDDEGQIGFIDCWWLDEEKTCSEQEISRLHLLVEVLSSLVRRHRAAAIQRESEERFRSLAEHVSDTLCELDLEGRVLFASANVGELTGYDADEIRAVDLVELVHPEDRLAVLEERERRLSTGAARTRAYRVRHRDGSYRHVEVAARQFESAAGETRVAVVLRDVTDVQRRRVELERRLEIEQHMSEFSRRFLERGDAEADAAITHGLEAAAKLAGADRSFLVAFVGGDGETPATYEWHADSMSVDPLRPDPGLIGRREYFARRLLEGDSIRVSNLDELPEEAADVRAMYAEMGIQSFVLLPIRDGERWIGGLGFYCYAQQRDWSDEELALLRLIAGLFASLLRRSRVEEALGESQNRLVQAQKMEAVGTLAGGIAHDFNNQLAVMLGNARYVLRSVREDPILAESLADLERAAEHCAQLTRSLLAFSRRGAVLPQVLDVRDAVADACELLEPLMPSFIEFRRDPGADVGSVFADPTQLQQVFVNLVVNARDAMPKGGALTIATRCCELGEAEVARLGLVDTGGYVEIAVEDEGVGMDEETRSRIFEPFFTTKEVGKGTGLGLATTYGIVKECKGAISVESTPGEGSRFRILLPRLAEVEATRGDDRPGVEPGVSRGEGVVLLVEDEPGVRRFLGRTLRAAGYEVLEAGDGIDALEAMGEGDEEIDFLVTDLEMPRMGGVELASEVTRLQPRVAVLFLSGYAPDRLMAVHPPVDGARFLQKPFADWEVLRELDRLRKPC